MRSLEEIEQFRAGYDYDEAQSSQGGASKRIGSVVKTVGAANDAGLKTYIRADEENKQEVGEYVDVYEDGGTMMIKDQEGAGAKNHDQA